MGFFFNCNVIANANTKNAVVLFVCNYSLLTAQKSLNVLLMPLFLAGNMKEN